LALKTYRIPEFHVERSDDLCIRCEVCVRQCGHHVHSYDAGADVIRSDHARCVACQRCVAMCPTHALRVMPNVGTYHPHGVWSKEAISELNRQAETGGVLLTGSGNDRPYRVYWDNLLLNASQVTNPSIDPLREPMELRTHLGGKPDRVEVKEGKLPEYPAQVRLGVPVMFSAMSYGAVSFNAQLSIARAAKELGTLWNTGEGGLHPDLEEFKDNTIVQVASGRFGVSPDYLNAARFVEIKIGQGAKPGIGGHLPGEKVSADVARTRMIPEGSDAISPAPQHDIYSIEDLSMLIHALKEATNWQKPVSVKVAAVHNVAAIASGIVRAGADIVAVDGFRGGTGAAPTVIRDNVGIPIEFALAAIDSRLRAEGIRNRASIIAGGGIRNSGDIVKAIALGADAVYIGTATLVGLGCALCQKCYTGICNWGITTQDPYLWRRLNPDIASQRLVNMVRGWEHEIKEMLGGMGLNAIESLRGNRDHLRAIGLTDSELRVLGVRTAGA